MRTYRVSYRLIVPTHPHAAITFTYIVDAKEDIQAQAKGWASVAFDMEHLLNKFDEQWVKRTTVIRLK